MDNPCREHTVKKYYKQPLQLAKPSIQNTIRAVKSKWIKTWTCKRVSQQRGVIGIKQTLALYNNLDLKFLTLEKINTSWRLIGSELLQKTTKKGCIWPFTEHEMQELKISLQMCRTGRRVWDLGGGCLVLKTSISPLHSSWKIGQGYWKLKLLEDWDLTIPQSNPCIQSGIHGI